MRLCNQLLRYRTIPGWIIILLFCSTFLAFPVFAEKSPTVRVLLLEKKDSVEISGAMEIKGYRSPLPFTGNKLFTKKDLKVTLTITAQSGFLAVNGRLYRGEIVIKPASDGLKVINCLSLEEYLYGVLPGEVDPKWPMDALKAQAVAARSYALAQVRWRANQDFDLYNDLRSQVYYGVSKETPSTTEAVLETRGQIARYAGEVIQANFFAASGGQTANSEDVWGLALPYLRSVPDYDQSSPHYSWKIGLPVDELQARLEANGICVGKLINLLPIERDSSNRVKTIKIIGEQGEVIITGTAFRFILGLKSTNFTVSFSVDQGSLDNVSENQRDSEQNETAVKFSDNIDSTDTTISSDYSVHTQIGDVLESREVSEEENIQTVETRPIVEMINLIFAENEQDVGGQCKTATQDTANSFVAELIAQVFDFYANNSQPLEGQVQFIGFGWGHGVGLSQWGAREMALNGASYEKILTHYYQGIEIYQLYD